MDIKPIRTEQDYSTAMERIRQLWGAPVGSPEGDELEVLSILVERYEEEHYPIPPSDPVEAIKFRLDQQGLTTRDLEPFIGSSGRVSEVLNRKRKLSLSMVKRLHDGLRIPYESLLS
ncbi:transcriptional regulator (plasmid) [Cupriavidus sp. KK10]|jgi:HTH-type transcriptional regulator/antitoxin HigA|uniref:helix-turn-helix domain-containing protein n=1 Tax=Cupriavidus sp. KK10 TaxID=1478019 RepID=UPI001BAC073A|nr:transcriptional regulator [Cupriavidus sp. KK10]QUN32648.1 transcriptional regulator [Cupriavidus sp. KK10]